MSAVTHVVTCSYTVTWFPPPVYAPSPYPTVFVATNTPGIYTDTTTLNTTLASGIGGTAINATLAFQIGSADGPVPCTAYGTNVAVQPPGYSAPTTTPSTTTTSSSSTSSVSIETTSQATDTTTPTTSSSTSSISPASSQTPPSNPKTGVSKGEAAGIAIACAVVGAIVTGIALCLFWRRRPTGKPRNNGFSRSSTINDRQDSKAPAINMTAVSRPGAGSDWQSRLPLPIQDREIVGDFSRLGNAIKNHAQSYFGGYGKDAKVTAADLLGPITVLLGPASSITAQTMVTRLSDARTRVGAVRLLIGQAIVQRITPGSKAEESLLPPELAETYASILTSDRNAEGSILLARWRQISGTTLQAKYGAKAIGPNDPRVHNLQSLTEQLDLVLRRFASGHSDDLRLQNLTELLKRAARFGYMLFTQPTEWVFDWEQPRSNHGGETVVWPALLQISDEQGQRRASPQRLGEEAQTVYMA